METFSVLLAICAGNSPVPSEFPAQRPVGRSFDVFFDLRLNKRLSKQSWSWWFEMLSRPLWRQCNAVGARECNTHKVTQAYANLLNAHLMTCHQDSTKNMSYRSFKLFHLDPAVLSNKNSLMKYIFIHENALTNHSWCYSYSHLGLNDLECDLDDVMTLPTFVQYCSCLVYCRIQRPLNWCQWDNRSNT